MFGWLRERRRRSISTSPFPSAWLDILRRTVKQTVWLSDDEAERLRAWVAIFLA
jgi:hypothetical protein